MAVIDTWGRRGALPSPRPARPQLERARVRIAVGPQWRWETQSKSGTRAGQHPAAREARHRRLDLDTASYPVHLARRGPGGGGLWPVTVRSDNDACAHTAFKPRACGPALDHDGWRRTGRAATGASLRAHCHAAAALKCMSTLSTGWRRQPGGGPSESPGANRPTATLTPGRLRRARPGTAHESRAR